MNSPLSSALPYPGSIDPKLFGVVPASRLQRPAVPLVSSGVTEIDELTGGFPRGALTEIYGPASSGRSSVLLAALAAATQREEICALVDSTDSFDPYSGAATGIALERLLWIRCGQAGTRTSSQKLIAGSRNVWMQRLEQVLKITDLLLQGSGFGMVAVDLADVPPEFVRRVPLASWFRFCRTIERTPNDAVGSGTGGTRKKLCGAGIENQYMPVPGYSSNHSRGGRQAGARPVVLRSQREVRDNACSYEPEKTGEISGQ